MTKEKKIQLYEERATFWLAQANQLAERGETKRAERYYATSEYWLVRANTLRGW
jgi:hypothetical protein